MNKRVTQTVAFVIMGLATAIIVIPLLAIIGFIIYRGYSAISWEFLTAMPRKAMKAGGIFPAIVGTFYLIVGTIAVSFPLGVLSAIYLTEYAKQGRLIRLIRLAIVNLAGIPSVVYGLFGLGVFVLLFKFGASILSGSLTLAILILPLIITTSEEALRSVPQSFRDGSLALGATKWQTIRNCVLPYAWPGIITGSILGVGRAAGETAPILFTAAAFFLPRLPKSIFDQVMALPYHLYVISTQIPKMPFEIQYGTALVLLALVLGLSLIAIIIRVRFRKAKKW